MKHVKWLVGDDNALLARNLDRPGSPSGFAGAGRSPGGACSRIETAGRNLPRFSALRAPDCMIL